MAMCYPNPFMQFLTLNFLDPPDSFLSFTVSIFCLIWQLSHMTLFVLTGMTMTRHNQWSQWHMRLCWSNEKDDMNSCLESEIPMMTWELLKMLLKKMASCLVTARMTNIQMRTVSLSPTRLIQMVHILQVSKSYKYHLVFVFVSYPFKSYPLK